METTINCTNCSTAVKAGVDKCPNCKAEYRYRFGYDFVPDKTLRTGKILLLAGAVLLFGGITAAILYKEEGFLVIALVFGLAISVLGATKFVSGRDELRSGKKWWKVQAR